MFLALICECVRYEANDPFVQELIVKLDELLSSFKVRGYVRFRPGYNYFNPFNHGGVAPLILS